MPWIKVLNPNYSRREREGWSCWKERERQNQRDLPYLAASSFKLSPDGGPPVRSVLMNFSALIGLGINRRKKQR
jgi:hypothetical protein